MDEAIVDRRKTVRRTALRSEDQKAGMAAFLETRKVEAFLNK